MPLIPERRETIIGSAAALTGGELTCEALLERCLARIDAWEDQIHAWVSVDREGARRQARECDAKLAKHRSAGSVQQLSPLFGIPIGIKDIIDIAGQPTGAGSGLLASGPLAQRDATVVRKLREAGAIILGKTVTTQFACFDPPPTRNPWNLAHTPGGSSSGSAAGVAAGMCLGAIGSQTGGSIIRPASFCGVAGCKPTFGRVSLDGFVPVAPSLDTVGPIAGCVVDLAIILNAIASDHKVAGVEPSLNLALDLADLTPEKLKPPRLAAVDNFFVRCDPAMQVALNRAAIVLRVAGASIESRGVHIDWLDSHRTISAHEFAASHRERFSEVPTDYLPSVTKLIQEGLWLEIPPLYGFARHRQAKAINESVELMQDVDALVCPAARGPAPDLSTTGDPAFQSLWTYTGQPTITFPLGISNDGLPLGIQLIGRRFDEAGLFRVAAWCEAVLPGLTPQGDGKEPTG
jgi:Asp-tRNA(Asn)/Glu-tRNA(Gln) amidotransferase A subunit family amidase